LSTNSAQKIYLHTSTLQAGYYQILDTNYYIIKFYKKYNY